jgi:hypothetical protein
MKKRIRPLVACILISLFLSACGPGQLFGPTITPSPTATLTPTPTDTPTPTPVPTSTLTPTPSPIPTITSLPPSDELGGSFETAVVIQASNEFEGVAMEYQWLDERYPGYQTLSQTTASQNGKIYDLIMIETIDGTQMMIYFDITAFYGKF